MGGGNGKGKETSKLVRKRPQQRVLGGAGQKMGVTETGQSGNEKMEHDVEKVKEKRRKKGS